MTTISFIPDTGATVVLIQRSRDWMEHDITLNHQRIDQALSFFRGDYEDGIDRGNRKNTISFLVTRGVDDSGRPFADAEAALIHLLDHPQVLPAKGTLKLEIKGATTSATRYLQDALPQAIEVQGAIGVTLVWKYTFKGGALVKSNAGS